jgi:hypothetical protein
MLLSTSADLQSKVKVLTSSLDNLSNLESMHNTGANMLDEVFQDKKHAKDVAGICLNQNCGVEKGLIVADVESDVITSFPQSDDSKVEEE